MDLENINTSMTYNIIKRQCNISSFESNRLSFGRNELWDRIDKKQHKNLRFIDRRKSEECFKARVIKYYNLIDKLIINF